jgi:hypothetical protein
VHLLPTKGGVCIIPFMGAYIRPIGAGKNMGAAPILPGAAMAPAHGFMPGIMVGIMPNWTGICCPALLGSGRRDCIPKERFPRLRLVGLPLLSPSFLPPAKLSSTSPASWIDAPAPPGGV